MKRFLITTADERTWRHDRPVLFLGEWCRLYDRRASWEHLDAEVVPYHWDDRRQFDNDYETLQRTCESLLHLTSSALNEHHGTKHSARYWRMLIGPWFYHCVPTLFDRWTMVQKVANAYEIGGTLIDDTPPASMIAADLAEFSGVRVQDVTWNHHIFGRAIQYQEGIPWQKVPVPRDVSPTPGLRPRQTFRRAARTAIRSRLSSSLALFTRRDEAMIIRSHLPRLAEMKLQLALGQVPKLWDPPPIEAVPPDMAQRGRFQITNDSADPFVRFAAELIPEQIPTVYLEGYRNLRRTAERLPWPARPKVIFTSNLYAFCEVFQEWAAVKTEAGYPLVIGQHGGFVGSAKRTPSIDHQLKLCSRYLSWGWRDARPQVHPTAVLTNIGRRVGTWTPSGDLLLVSEPIRLFAFRCTSWPVGANQSATCASEQIRFAVALGETIRTKLTLRIREATDREMNTCYIERWKDAVPGVRIDPSTGPIERSLRRCRLFVYTHNSTGYLEALARNIPTVMFWSPRYFELRPDAQPYFDLLREARIYHETPESAARHVIAIWDDVAEWWHQPAVQQACRTFCEQYARMPKSPLRVVRDALLSVPGGSKPVQIVPSACM